MYPVQLVNTYHTAMINHYRCVTTHKHTGRGYHCTHLYNAFIQINKQTQDFVRLVSYRYSTGQYSIGIYCPFWHACIRFVSHTAAVAHLCRRRQEHEIPV